MGSFKLAIQGASLAAWVFALTACDGTQSTAVSGQSSDTKQGVVFAETFSDSGRFTIVQNPLGGYN